MDSEFFALVMDHDPNLVFVKDENSVILYANRAFLEVFPPEKRAGIIGTTTIEDFQPDEAALFLAEDRRAMALGRSEIVEDVSDYTGRKRVLLTRKIAFTCVTGAPRLLAISTDITELAERERHLAEANDRLAQFSAFAAHDLRSPISSIVSALDMIRHDRETTLSPRAESYVDLMMKSGHGLARQVTSLLESARAENRSELATRETDLNLLMNEIRFNLSSQLEAAGATLHSARLPNLDVEPQLFRQLLQNLIENALAHHGDRLPMVIVRHEETGAEHVISVEDNGIGIAPGEMESVFEEFEQGERAEGGTGIGLALCRRVVGLHQGRISIDPAYRDGCRVVVALPKEAVAAGALRNVA